MTEYPNLSKKQREWLALYPADGALQDFAGELDKALALVGLTSKIGHTCAESSGRCAGCKAEAFLAERGK